MMHTELMGRHETTDGEAMTLQDLLELLRSLPRQARDNYVTVYSPDNIQRAEVRGLAFAQSDQAEKWEFKISLLTTEWY